MTINNLRKGQCFCGSVTFALEGEPEVMAHCHCDSCRQWSAGEFTAFTLWPTKQIEITSGSQFVSSFNRAPSDDPGVFTSDRCWCSKCGGHLFIKHSSLDLVDVPAVLIEGLEFKAAFHANYSTTVHHLPDGIPKFENLPEEAGGSGVLLPD